jgi:hypothetical protein
VQPATFAGTGRPEESLSLWGYYVRTIGETYANFHGRARRKEYWDTGLFYSIFLVLLVIVWARRPSYH